MILVTVLFGGGNMILYCFPELSSKEHLISNAIAQKTILSQLPCGFGWQYLTIIKKNL